jgi:NAD(P)-dependent dehydrogenase (short-subunit alcohol dehydrogenase family)
VGWTCAFKSKLKAYHYYYRMNGLARTKKTILITGATDGIGLETAKALVTAGHRVLLHGRNEAKLQAVAASIRRLCPRRDGDDDSDGDAATSNVETYRADFSRLSEVDGMAKQIVAHDAPPKIDVLINNAGILKPTKDDYPGAGEATITVDKLDVRFAVNTIAPFLLTKRLLPILMSSSSQREKRCTAADPTTDTTTGRASTVGPTTSRAMVINICSPYHAQKIVDPTALNGTTQVAMADFDAYAQSKLALIMWTNALAVQNDRVDFLSLHPGSMLATKMVTRQRLFGGGVATNTVADFPNPVTIGADIIVRAALQRHGTLQQITNGSAAAFTTTTLGQQKNYSYFDNDRRTYGTAHHDASDPVLCQEVVDQIETILRNKGIRL